MTGRVVLAAGTRPELVKLSPVARVLAGAGVPAVLVTTGQHGEPRMRDAFLREPEWPCPVESLGLEPGSPVDLLARILAVLPGRLAAGDLVVVEGDTTSVVGASLVAGQLGRPLAHVEAGLRSYDRQSPEEGNRRVADHLADLLFAPTDVDAAHLREERCPGEVFVVGNTVLDAVRLHMDRAPGRTATAGSILVTLHRRENVDRPEFLETVVRFLEQAPRPCLFPVHPRTRDRLQRQGLWRRLRGLARVTVVEPMGYLDFLAAMRDAHVILTDSGGVQEEATAPEIRRPVVVLRRATERGVALAEGFSILAPLDLDRLGMLVEDLSWFRPADRSPFGTGHAAEAIVEVLAQWVGR